MRVSKNAGLLITALGVSLGVTTDPALARRNNPPAQRTGSPASGGATCQSCHDFNVGSGSIQLLNAPAFYFPNQAYDITVRVEDSAQAGAGFQLSVENDSGHVGALSVLNATNTELNDNDSNYVNHTGTGVNNSVTNWVALGDAAEYTVRWTAPAVNAGDVTFWAAGNAINDDGSPIDDFIYLTAETAMYGPDPSVPAASTWGLLVLVLGLMTGGTLLVLRQRTAALEPSARIPW